VTSGHQRGPKQNGHSAWGPIQNPMPCPAAPHLGAAVVTALYVGIQGSDMEGAGEKQVLCTFAPPCFPQLLSFPPLPPPPRCLGGADNGHN
jgi:hypothetical protein